MTSSSGIENSTPASAISAEASATAAPVALRCTHGTSTRPPTGRIRGPSGPGAREQRRGPPAQEPLPRVEPRQQRPSRRRSRSRLTAARGAGERARRQSRRRCRRRRRAHRSGRVVGVVLLATDSTTAEAPPMRRRSVRRLCVPSMRSPQRRQAQPDGVGEKTAYGTAQRPGDQRRIPAEKPDSTALHPRVALNGRSHHRERLSHALDGVASLTPVSSTSRSSAPGRASRTSLLTREGPRTMRTPRRPPFADEYKRWCSRL